MWGRCRWRSSGHTETRNDSVQRGARQAGTRRQRRPCGRPRKPAVTPTARSQRIPSAIRPLTSAYALPDVQPGDRPADQHPLDLRRALEDGEDRGLRGSFRTHGGPCCQEGMANSPGGLKRAVAGRGGTVMWLSSSLRALRRRAGRGQAGAPAAPRRQARARTNELDAGKRRPMMRSEEEPLGLRFVRKVAWLGFPGRGWSPEWSHMHPFGSCPGPGGGS